jgi:ATP-dependent exoDNAse (exonuclease V) alpha subunit
MMDKQIENQKEIARKNKKKYQPPLRLEKHIYSNNSQDVDLFIGSPVIAITNKKGIFVNGEKFVVDKIGYDSIELKNDRTFVKVEIKDFQKWFHVAYAITSHKSQGQTFNNPYTIHEWSKLSIRCKYVSLSRSDSWENCNIIDI